MQKRLLITGANSFIGRYLVKEASAQGFKVIAVVRKNCKTRDSIENIHNVDIMEYDMNEYGGIGSRFKNVDCCVNLSWSGTRGSLRNDEEIQKENYENGLALFKSLLENGCKKIITVGSQAEYGNADGIISEDTPCYPNTAYGKYKLKLYEELTTIAQKHNASYIDARIFSIYGPGDYENTLIMSLIKNMSLNKACDLTTCTQLWDYLYVEDAAKALLTLASKQCEDGVYNIAYGESKPLKEYVFIIKDILNSKSEINFGAIENNNPINLEVSTSKLCRLGWLPFSEFEEGMKKLVYPGCKKCSEKSI